MGELADGAGAAAPEKPSLEAFEQRLLAGDWEAKRAALEALGRRGLEPGEDADKALGLAVRHLEDEDCHVRRAALTALVRLAAAAPPEPTGARAAEHLECALARLQDDDWGVRRVALGAVGEFAAQGDARALELLTPHLRDDDEDVRSAALASIGKVGTSGDAQLEGLAVKLLEDDDEAVRLAAVRACATTTGSGG